jgi:hypothetical protein
MSLETTYLAKEKGMSKSLVICAALALLAGSVSAEVYYHEDFTSDPFAGATPWTKVIAGTGGSSAAWSSGKQALWVYSPDKTSQANVYSPTISGQGTEYEVKVKFTPSSVPSGDNMGYVLEPMTATGSNRDIVIGLLYSGDSSAKLIIRSTVGADVWNWSYQDALLPMVMGTTYEIKYQRSGQDIQVWGKKAADADWIQLVNSAGSTTFKLVGGQAADSTFDKFHAGLASISSRYQVYIDEITVQDVQVPEPMTVGLLVTGAAGLLLKRRHA